MSKTDAGTVAWILMAISFWDKDSVTQEEIVHSADAINHSTPTDTELSSAIDFLTRSGLVVQDGLMYRIGTAGKTLLESVGSTTGNVFDTLEALKDRISNQHAV